MTVPWALLQGSWVVVKPGTERHADSPQTPPSLLALPGRNPQETR
ncbi:hypothetical protein [Streptomyces sp. NBC_00582]|nr:hypothetical protein [Streptomyces sp. NBC_00582]WUB68284.1 hypothetical protein OG852_46245 [Streptomyces sp. NBC_00582]